MIELHAVLVSIVPGIRVAQLAIDGRGLARIPLSTSQEVALRPSVGKAFRLVIEEEAPGVEQVGL